MELRCDTCGVRGVGIRSAIFKAGWEQVIVTAEDKRRTFTRCPQHTFGIADDAHDFLRECNRYNPLEDFEHGAALQK